MTMNRRNKTTPIFCVMFNFGIVMSKMKSWVGEIEIFVSVCKIPSVKSLTVSVGEGHLRK